MTVFFYEMFLWILAHLPFLPTNNSLMTWSLSAVDSCFRDTCTCRCHILTSTVRITITRFSVHGTSVLQEEPSCSNVVSPSHPRSKKSLVFLGTAFTQCCFENYYTFFSGPVKLEHKLTQNKWYYIEDHLKKVSGACTERKDALRDIFEMQEGEVFNMGLLDAETEKEYDLQLQKLHNRWEALAPRFHEWFLRYVYKMTPSALPWSPLFVYM